MPRIFDLDRAEYALYETALKEAEISADNELRSIAINLRYDHRVSAKREKEFRKFFEKAIRNSSTEPLKYALKEYQQVKISDAVTPDYCLSSYHGLIADCSTSKGYCCKPFDKNRELVTVMNLNNLKEKITAANDAHKYAVQSWKKYSNNLGADENDINDSMFGDWLDSHLDGKDPNSDEVENFINAVFKVLNSSLKKKRYNLCWVTFWTDFQQHALTSAVAATADADRWNQAVGVGRNSGQWQIVIKYPAKAVDCIYRPTQLDSGYNPYHFPPPRRSHKATGGHTMDLAPADDVLLPEYIHRQIKLKPQYWVKGLIGKTRKTSGDRSDLPDLRKNHYRKLKKQYDPKDTGKFGDWMPTPF